MLRVTRIALALVPAALLAACGGDDEAGSAPAASDDGREASGEVLPGSISDAMIETDRLRSQPPLVIDEPEAGGDPATPGNAAAAQGEGDENTSDEEDSGSSDEEADSAPESAPAQSDE